MYPIRNEEGKGGECRANIASRARDKIGKDVAGENKSRDHEFGRKNGRENIPKTAKQTVNIG